MTLPDFAWGALGAAVSWPIVEFVARPFRQFFDIRRQVNRCLVMYGNVRARDSINQKGKRKPNELPTADGARLTEAENTFRGLAADMRAFANGEPAANRAVKLLGYDANKIASALIGLSSNIGTAGQAKADAKYEVERLLGIRSVE